MGALVQWLYPWGFILQGLAVVHFIRRRPDAYWLWIILFFGPLGAAIYIAFEVIPDLGLLRGAFDAFPRRKRIRQLEAAVLDNPSAGNYEELADLYSDQGDYVRARDCYNKAISSRADSIDAFYRRGVASIHLGDFSAAAPDLEYVVSRDPKYDFHRAAVALAQAYASAGRPEEADELFQQATRLSTSSEIYFSYASFLASQQRNAEAREWAERILAKKPTMPSYLRRRERPWFRKAQGLLKRLPR